MRPYILAWRQSLDATFPLFVTLLDGVKSADAADGAVEPGSRETPLGQPVAAVLK